ncbi:hypothetical protein [Nonomuraea aurantiaca]|uniref:hypothetical protein n=1 Tax=Nonomuraea aurantiaca TaxID=2878562 RepID=UPI001CDA1F50|nr:hypothetical protein [Nonomuraea aurantiaca]MCA2229749.1 hypothetical protein [Nonomuraea aurantiaca]
MRTATDKRLHATVAKATRRADPALPGELIDLLEIPEGKRWSHLERLRRSPTRLSGTGMARPLERVEEIAAFRLGRVKLAHVPPNRLSALARYGLGSKTPNLARAGEPKRTAMVCAVVRHLEATAIDDALDLFALLMATKLINPARRATDKERLVMLPRLQKASRTLARASRVLVERLHLVEETQIDLDVAALWKAVETVASREQVHQALEQVEAMIGDEEDDGGDSVMRRTLAERHNTVRPFLALLGESAARGAASGGRRVLAAVKRLPALARRKVKQKPLLLKEIDDKLVPPVRRCAVYANPDLPTGSVDRNAYVMCVLEQLTRATRTRHLRLPLPPVVRSAGQAAVRGAVAGGARGRAGRPEPGGTGREALG